MLNPPQGIVTFAGIQGLPFLDFNFTLTHGRSPNVFSIQIPPQPGGRLIQGGSVVITYGGQRVEFRSCKVDTVDAVRTNEGFEVWTLNILDRRWKWAFGEISGYYNVRRGGGIVDQTRKSARELCLLCLDAMGEQRPDVSAIPNDQFPEVEWDYANPSEALARLCDEVGCRIVLGLDDRVRLNKAGVGRPLPRGGTALEDALTLNPPERPDELRFVGDRTLRQADFKLEAVAEDTDGSIKLLSDVSYAPRDRGIHRDGNKWALADLDAFECVEEKHRERAKQNAYRKYRIVVPIRVPAPDGNIRVADINELLPIENDLLETEVVHGEERRKPAVVWGVYAMHDAGVLNSNEVRDPDRPDRFTGDLERHPDSIYHRGFKIDARLGIVEFSEPVFMWETARRRFDGESIDESYMMPAEIHLRVAFGIRQKDTSAWTHFEIARRSPQRRFGTKPEYVKVPDVPLTYRWDARRGRWIDNLREYRDAAKTYLDEHERRYETDTPQGMTWPGIVAVQPDGAIQQVTWSITERGTTTRATRNLEEILVGKSYKERRLDEVTAEAVKRRLLAARHEAERLGRGK